MTIMELTEERSSNTSESDVKLRYLYGVLLNALNLFIQSSSTKIRLVGHCCWCAKLKSNSTFSMRLYIPEVKTTLGKHFTHIAYNITLLYKLSKHFHSEQYSKTTDIFKK